MKWAKTAANNYNLISEIAQNMLDKTLSEGEVSSMTQQEKYVMKSIYLHIFPKSRKRLTFSQHIFGKLYPDFEELENERQKKMISLRIVSLN